ncbi:MAG: DnaJ domain-containing protein [Methanothrix sp.]|nr:DnaJ domain-containing protein [Methanothrix sp.]
MMSNFYEILNIKYDANEDDIKKAYRKLAIKYHPDKNNGDKKSEENFREITEAYEILKDFSKRKIYDRINNINALRIKKSENIILETTKDIDNKHMNIKPSVIIDPNGNIYVDVANNNINPNSFNDFF